MSFDAYYQIPMQSIVFAKIKVQNVIFRLISVIYFENHVQIDPIQSVKL